MRLSVAEIARHLGGASRSGDNFSCRCPAHEDRTASLSITQNSEGKMLVHCHAGCDPMEVISHLRAQDLWPMDARPAPAPAVVIDLPRANTPRKIVATYDYIDEAGELLYQAVRYEPKDFRQRKPINGSGAWDWSIKGVRRVLYRLPEVLQAVADKTTVYICEGEKDVEVARSLGLVATCNAMGADNGTGNKWAAEFSTSLAGAHVVVVPDQDEAGARHAAWVVQNLSSCAASVRVLDVPYGKDLADWVEAGATRQDIEEATTNNALQQVQAAQAATPTQPGTTKRSFHFLDMADLMADIKPIDWIVRDYIESDSINLIYGPVSSGKSFLAVDIAACVAMDQEWLGHSVKTGPVFYIAGEGHNGLARRFRAWHVSRGIAYKHDRIFKSGGALSILDEDAVLGMVKLIEEMVRLGSPPPAMVQIDTLARNFGHGDENSTEDMSTFITHLDRHIRQRWACAVVIVHHSGHNMERARGSSALKAAVDSEIEVSKDEAGNMRIKVTKMKEAEPPPEMMMRIKRVELPGLFDDKGLPVSSAVLEMAGNLIFSVVATRDDGTQILAKDALEVLARGWLSVRGLGEALCSSKRQVDKVFTALGKYKFTADKALTLEGTQALSTTGYHLVQKDKPIYLRSEGGEL